MLLFVKGLIIGIGKVIPGVSGALLAINFKVYERAIEAIVNFFDDWKNNLKFLFLLGSGILLSIVMGSGIVRYFLNNYQFITMMFFIGLIGGGTYNFGKNIKVNFKDKILIGVIVLFLLLISLGKANNIYIIRGNFMDNIILFIGGIVEMLSSIIPGISGTALEMILGIYDIILQMISKIFDINFVLRNIYLYISFGLGMMTSFLGGVLLINCLLKKYREVSDKLILALCLYSLIMLVILTLKIQVRLTSYVLGLMILIIGLLIGCILDK